MKWNGMSQFSLLIFLILCMSQAKADFQSVLDIKDQVHGFIAQQLYESDDSDSQIEVTELDERLKLQACDNPLALEVSHGTIHDARLIVTASCPTLSWQLRVPVEIKRYVYALVANSTIKRGEPISDAQVTPMRLEVGPLGRFFQTPDELQGYVAKTTIRQGKVLKPYMFKLPQIIKRGDIVTIQMQLPGLDIQTKGTAMQHGVKNQTIQVRNVNSDKLIEATVVGPNTVKVNL